MRVPVVVRVSALGLAVMGFYTWYANSIPQIWLYPPEDLSLEATMSPEQLVAAGDRIFHSKGQCTTCHGMGQAGRGPDLAGVGGRAGTRKPGMSAKAYLIEHLLHPGFFVVPGFPNIMPAVNQPPIGLNRSELWAVVAFLETQGGTVDVKREDIPASAEAAGGGSSASPFTVPGDPKAGQAVFTGKGTCIACHRASPVGGGQVGPDLSAVGAIQTPEYLMGKILNPASKGTVAGFPAGVMPSTFGQQLTAREFTDLLAFLLTLKGSSGSGTAPGATPSLSQAAGTAASKP